MIVHYDFLLVVLSVCAAMLGTYTAIIILAKARATRHISYKTRVACGSLALGVGIWSMHFIGLLAIQLPIPASYAFLPTLMSSLVAVVLTGLALYAATSGVLNHYGRLVGAVLMGLGISAMHYVGMDALRIVCRVTYSNIGIISAFAISVGVSWVALRVLTSSAMKGRNHIVASIILGIGISAMHYVAMFGTRFDYLDSSINIVPSAIDNTYLAGIIALVTFLLLDAFLLLSLPNATDSTYRRKKRLGFELAYSLSDTWRKELSTDSVKVSFNGPDVSPQTKFSPLNISTELTPDQPASNLYHLFGSTNGTPAAGTGGDKQNHDPLQTEDDSSIQISRNGEVRFIKSSSILYISASGHYTQIGHLNEQGSLEENFCDRRLSSLEDVLDQHGFIKVHRSHLVNLDRVVGYKRHGETGEVIFSTNAAKRIPISRKHFPLVSQAITRNQHAL
ncbi:MHYT domain-containing protein [Emcibacter sp.]|uniref:MHYT domain-containing protein n=1 Tax=Emcibacter sp. TaxID=1979954 RepID=UPI002AA6E79F|nr:MHYT domain-containing protein [Emcibacter sp.]